MAKYDHGGGCPCGLYAECGQDCEMHPGNCLRTQSASGALMALIRLPLADKLAVLRRLETLMRAPQNG